MFPYGFQIIIVRQEKLLINNINIIDMKNTF